MDNAYSHCHRQHRRVKREQYVGDGGNGGVNNIFGVKSYVMALCERGMRLLSLSRVGFLAAFSLRVRRLGAAERVVARGATRNSLYYIDIFILFAYLKRRAWLYSIAICRRGRQHRGPNVWRGFYGRR